MPSTAITTSTHNANGSQAPNGVSMTRTLTYDADRGAQRSIPAVKNRLVSVSGSGMTASFVYDGDGNRVQSTINGVTTVYIGNYYEKSGANVTKYYYAGAMRIAMKSGSGTTWLLGDHLGSTSLAVNGATGLESSEQRYMPFGEVRFGNGTLPTKYTFTGQYSNVADFGLMYYGARWYDVSLGRFASADTIIPGAGNPQSWDRYAYANNSPLIYTDPSGYFSEEELNNWFCNGKEGCYWGDRFNEYWQKILLKGELGDAFTYTWNDGKPVFAVFATQDGMLVGWDLNSKTAQSIPRLTSRSQDEKLALYRSQNANINGGPTQGIPEFIGNGSSQYNGANHYVYISGWGGGKEYYDLPNNWYQGSNGSYVGTSPIVVGMASPSLGNYVTGANAGLEIYIAYRAAAIPGKVVLKAFGGPVGVAVLAIDVASLIEYDTNYYITTEYQGPFEPVPTPPTSY